MDGFEVIDVLRAAGDWLASPAILYTAALSIFLLGARTRILWRRPAGVGWLLLAAAVLALGAGDAVFRQRLLDPRNLPVAAWTLLTLCSLWLLLHRARREPPPARSGWSGPSRAEWGAALVAGLSLIAVAAALEAPLGPPAELVSGTFFDGGSMLTEGVGVWEPSPAKRPWFARSLQEASFYFDPWVARFLLPALLLAALLALPWIDPEPGDGSEKRPRGTAAPDPRERRLLAFLAVTLLVVLLPMVVATYLRGPQWNTFSPFEVWGVRPRPVPPVALSERLWCDALGRNAPPGSWLIRELPGLAILTLYLAVLPWWLPRWKATRGVFGRYRRTLGPWRYHLASTLALLLLAVPLKMYGRWLFDIGYWLHLPEFSFSF